MNTEMTKDQIVGIDKKIPFFEQVMFSSTTGIGTFYFLMIQTWLLFFYTDILKIDAAYVGVMFIVIRIFDAVITPVFGTWIDRQNTRWGKYKPWMLILGLGLVVSGFLSFLPTHFSPTGNIIYATITYFFFSVIGSILNGPNMGLTAAMTKRQDDRMMISIIGFVWVLIFSIIVTAGSQPIINALGQGDQGAGFRSFMLIFMIVFALFYALIAKVAKERFTLTNESAESFTFKAIVNSFVKNKYAVITVLYVFALNLTTAIRSTVGIYYYKYYFNQETLLALVGGITILPTLLGSFLSPVVTKKLGLRVNILIAVGVSMVTSIAMFFLPATDSGQTAFIILSALGGLLMGIAQPAQGTMMPLAIDYGEWKFKTNSGALFGSLNGFFQTLATAITGGVVALVLALVHYVPDVQQTATALNGIRFLMTLFPAILFIFGLVIVRWDMTEERHMKIINELKERRAQETPIHS